MQCHTRACTNVRVYVRMYVRLCTRVGWAEEDGAGPSVVVVESDSAGPSATVTEVRNMVVLESKSERSRRLLSQRIGGARHDAHAYS